MRAVRRICARFFNFTTNRRGDERLREEMKEHVTLQKEENIRAGMAPVEAHRQAALKFGAVESIRESYHAEEGLDRRSPGIMYLPAAQIPDEETRMMNGLLGESWVVRTESPRVDVLPAIRRIFMENAQAPLLAVEPMNEVISDSVAQQRFSMILLCGFGLISLVLGAAGLYGVMSYNVARQTREIGVRMALGARREDVAEMVLRDAAALVGIGIVIGIGASLLGAKIVGSLLFGVKPRDPLTLAAASTVLLLTGLCAAWWPARRAARVEPMDALRSE
jgi:hypothetical protein